jgi:tetratricopeptide (TPR) repeat protein
MTLASSRALVWLLVGWFAGVAITVVGFARATGPKPPSVEVVVAIGQLVDSEYQRIDLLLEQGEVAPAIAALEGLRAQPWPSYADGGDTIVELRHDVYGRLVRLRLDYPDVDPKPDTELLNVVDEGLGGDAHRVEVNPFTSRLVALRGEVLVELGRDDEALRAYERALELNEKLLERLSEDP